MTQYRLIHFVPDHAQGARFPIAAALASQDGVVVVESEAIPGAQCLGGHNRAAVLKLIRQSLREPMSFDRLPTSTGPHAVLDVVREIPADVDDAPEWIRTNILTLDKGTEDNAKRKGAAHRSGWGTAFFTRWNVQSYVRPKFRPERDLGGWLRDEARTLGPITHWVQGRSDVLLLEPVVLQRDSIKNELQEVGRILGAYRFAMQNRVAPKETKLVAYVLQGGREDDRRMAIDSLRSPAHEVIDTSDEREASRFTELIRRIALSAQSQGEFGS